MFSIISEPSINKFLIVTDSYTIRLDGLVFFDSLNEIIEAYFKSKNINKEYSHIDLSKNEKFKILYSFNNKEDFKKRYPELLI